MILKIILLVLLMIILALLLFFLSCILVPAVKEQTRIKDNIMFSKIEHKFDKLNENEISGISEENHEKMKAVVLCSCNKNFQRQKNVKVLSSQSCSLLYSQYGSVNFCSFSCLGMGDCKKICPQKAIEIKNSTAVITELCSGCGKCVSACPKGIIKLVPVTQEKIVVCSNPDDTFTTCSAFKNEEKIERSSKKRFKMWQYCYKLLTKK